MANTSLTLHDVTKIEIGKAITKIEAGKLEPAETSQYRLISICTTDLSGNPEIVEIRCFGLEPFDVTTD